MIDALIREIDEELGIQIRSATLWRSERFSYEHAHVELNFCRTMDWAGEPHSREGQAFARQSPAAIAVLRRCSRRCMRRRAPRAGLRSDHR